jgi:uncharacterized BrkB/YihY/UPF0761 family membrane protein
MATTDIVAPPPTIKLVDYPLLVGGVSVVVLTIVLVYFAGKFDPTVGTLTISLLVVLSFIIVVLFSLFFNIPNDELTSASVGGLVAAFGAVVAFWLNKSGGSKS